MGGFGFGGSGAGGGMPPHVRSGVLLFAPGALFAGLGLAILLVPDLLRYLVAVLCLGIGGILSLAALQLHRARQQPTQQQQQQQQQQQPWQNLTQRVMEFFRPGGRD